MIQSNTNLLSFWRPAVPVSLTRLHLRYQWGCVLSKGCEELQPSLSQQHIPLYLQSSLSLSFFDPSSLVISTSDFLQDTYAYIGIIWVIQGNLTILRTSDQQTLIAVETLIPPFCDVLRGSRNFGIYIVGRILCYLPQGEVSASDI